MSAVTPERFRRAKAIFLEAADRAPVEREAFLSFSCGEDAELRGEVRALLRAETEGRGFLEGAPTAPVQEAIEGATGPASPRPSRIGPYEVVDQIGHGGMGVVYLAIRSGEGFQTRVAIKVIKRGMDTNDIVRRFRTERQILASLDHPHIARLFDGGTTDDGLPYFVMEYIEGKSIDAYCEDRGLDTTQRVRLFLPVCAAVQYAHQNLVVHRDLKPGNILVTPEGAPKLLDFGVAKLVDPLDSAGAFETATAVRMLTPEYASPEQVRGERITTASDVYSLGVVLYKLLTGHTPYRPTGRGTEAISRAVIEQEPESAVRLVGGDLDNILRMALRKEPERRYGSAEQLAEDLRRALEGRPVSARRGTLRYRAAKFVRRHRVGVAASALAVLSLVSGLGAAIWEARVARSKEALAERRFTQVREAANALLFDVHDAIRDLAGSTPARALVVQRGLEYLDGLAKEAAGDRTLVRELAAAYRKVGDVQGNPYMGNLGDTKGAVESYRKAIALLEPLAAGGDATDEDRGALAGAYLVGGGIVLAAGDTAAAIDMSRKGVDLRQALLAARPADAPRRREMAQAWQFYAFNLQAAARHAEALEALRKQNALLLDLLAGAPRERGLLRSLGQNLFLLAQALEKTGGPAGGDATFAQAVDVQRDLLASDATNAAFKRDLAFTQTELGNSLNRRGDSRRALGPYREALALHRELALADPSSADARVGVAIASSNLGQAFVGIGDTAAAIDHLAAARKIQEAVVTKDPENAWVSGQLASTTASLARAHEAASRVRRQETSEVAEHLDVACRLFGRSIDLFAALEAKGRLTPDLRREMDSTRKDRDACETARAR
jgi:tetratricopeptide (TPR) repeat protein